METEESLPCTQEPANGPYLEPAESSPHPHTLFIYNRINIIPPIYAQ
jgi:hypothetical protein